MIWKILSGRSVVSCMEIRIKKETCKTFRIVLACVYYGDEEAQ